MVEYINNNNGIITEAIYPEMIQMVSKMIKLFSSQSLLIFFHLYSTPLISSAHCRHHLIRAALNLIPRKMSRLSSRHGLIYKLSMSSSYASWNRPIFSQTLRNVTSIVSSWCVSWTCLIRRIRVSETFLRPYFIVSMENSWGCGRLYESKLTMFSIGEFFYSPDWSWLRGDHENAKKRISFFKPFS